MAYTPSSFHRHLAAVDGEVTALFRRVAALVPVATEILLAGDTARAAALVAEDRGNEVLSGVENMLEVDVARGTPMGSDLRFLLTVLRIVPEMERTSDLALHVAQRASIGGQLPQPIRDSFASMGHIAGRMWDVAGDGWVARDVRVADRLDTEDDDLDGAVSDMHATVTGHGLDPTLSMECSLLGRFYERLGDHAVNVSRRLRWMVGPV